MNIKFVDIVHLQELQLSTQRRRSLLNVEFKCTLPCVVVTAVGKQHDTLTKLCFKCPPAAAWQCSLDIHAVAAVAQDLHSMFAALTVCSRPASTSCRRRRQRCCSGSCTTGRCRPRGWR